MSSFDDLLAAARSAVRESGPAPTSSELDQLLAASGEARTAMRDMQHVLADLAPDRTWSPMRSSDAGEEIAARVMVAMSFVEHVCPHLRSGGPQPAFVKLALHRIDCARCGGTVRRPPADEDDRCDWCGGRGVERFQPLVMQGGPLVVMGDACGDCAAAMVQEVEAR